MVSLPYPALSGEKPVPDAEEKKAVCTGAPVNCRLIPFLLDHESALKRRDNKRKGTLTDCILREAVRSFAVISLYNL